MATLSSARLPIVSFCVEDQLVDRFLDQLHGIDCETELLDSNSWLNDSALGPDGVTVLFCGTGTPDSSLLLKRLRESEGSLFVAVFGDSQPWQPELLQYCYEVISWPCCSRELAYRLSRCVPAPGTEGCEELSSDAFLDLNFVGRAPSFVQAVSLIRRIAACDAPVMITGETGTGKEIAARAIHYLGARSDYPFIPVNCGAIPDELFENELFGHRQGAYTDAKQEQLGFVSQAERGTLFVDEIDTLSHKAQAALLRFIQDQYFKPLGAQTMQRADIRIVAAANSDLGRLVEEGRFRRDLLFRINVLGLDMPSLRSRVDDIPLLAEHFMQRFAAQYGLDRFALDPSVTSWMKNHSWPGNVRELENFIHRAVLYSEGPLVSFPSTRRTCDQRPVEWECQSFNTAKAQALESFERSYLHRLMAEARGNVTLAAKRAGKERRALGKLLKKHGIDRRSFETGH